jgi:hypothetical protein
MREPVCSLAEHLKGRDVRAIVRGQLDGETMWVLFGPGDSGGYRVDNYVRKGQKWEPCGDSCDAGADEHAGWDMLGTLFVRAFTRAE